VVADRRRAWLAFAQVAIGGSTLNFGEVSVGEAPRRSFTIRNIGNVQAYFRFVPKPEDEHLCKSWLSIEPSFGALCHRVVLVGRREQEDWPGWRADRLSPVCVNMCTSEGIAGRGRDNFMRVHTAASRWIVSRI
jgi:hypothetical protein